MSLPSQEILDDIKDLITEITGFQENDENFGICERYCLSHVVHHTYPFVSKSTVKNLVNSYVSRFYGHGYFKVSQELNYQVKQFLSNEKLFEKNPQYDIQWSLLSLLSSLSSTLTSVKNLPELLPIEDEESAVEEINWAEYLTQDLPSQGPVESDSEHESDDDCSGSVKSQTESSVSQIDKTVVIFDNKKSFVCEDESESRRRRFEEFVRCRKSMGDIENDLELRGNLTEKFDKLLSQEGVIRKSQIMSELELMEHLLYQFQTGERILLHKGLVRPALVSLTQDTLSSFLESLQPYFKIIRSFRNFDMEVTSSKYPEKSKGRSFKHLKKAQSSFTLTSFMRKEKIPNVLYLYNVMLRKALEPFQAQITEIVDHLGNFTLIQMERKLQPYFFDLTSLFYVHKQATKNWKKDPNWLCSIRVLSVLYNAINNATTTHMSFLYLNVFLHCFQVYLDLIDSWVSSVDLYDPNNEFIVAKSDIPEGVGDHSCAEFEIREYRSELEASGIRLVPILDFLAEKMIHVGQSLEVLRHLNRFVSNDEKQKSSYHFLVDGVNEKIQSLAVETKKEPKPQEKKRSIFTMRNSNVLLDKDPGGGGDHFIIGNLLEELELDEKEKNEKVEEKKEEPEPEPGAPSTREFIYSTMENSFFKMAFDSVGIRQVENALEKGKMVVDEGDEALMVIKEPEKGKSGVFPFHKIISEAFHAVFEDRISGACALVKNIVLVECDLVTHLSLLRSVLLFNDDYLIQPFIMAFFTQPAIWGSPFSMTLHLKECVRGVYKDYANALSVALAKDSVMKCENVLQAIDNITVTYEVSWPLTLIITPGLMEKYNQIFRLALKLKWAHWALSGFHFPGNHEILSGTAKSTWHRIQILRFWFLSALTRINNYFMAQMLSWNADFESCQDFKEISQLHSDFLEKVHYNCLLSDKSPEGRQLIFHTLIPMCMDLWMEGSIVEEDKLSNTERVFGNCQLELSKLMSSLEKE